MMVDLALQMEKFEKKLVYYKNITIKMPETEPTEEECSHCKFTTSKDNMVVSLCGKRFCIWCEVEIYYLGNI